MNKRPLDLMMLGASWSQLSVNDIEAREVLLELDYIAILTDSIFLQPNLQYYLKTPSTLNVPLTIGLGIHIGL
jgi:carbohydrate-selective porin OprB